jgi:NAD(P)-dependent dehydrogenase (short-subunit alcohol dehydrogenase family)
MGRLDGKVAVITGGATGLGARIVEVYAREGARLIIGDIRLEQAQERADAVRNDGGEAFALTTDISDSSSVEALMAEAETRFGQLDIVTANAGILGRGHKKSLVDVTEDELRQIIDVNFVGTWNTLKHAIPALRRAGGGAISVTTSTSADRGTAKAPAYAASKGAVNAMIYAAAIDLMPDIRVNAVAPGAMATELGVHAAQEMGIDVSDVIAQAHAVTPADPIECALAHLYLVSPESAGMTGQVLTVDGGATVRHP